MIELPNIMVAPNGARLTKADHPAVPVTIDELVNTAKACFEAGAQVMHAHVRDHNQVHVLDAGLYKELIAQMAVELPAMPVQITTESAGRYSPNHQRKMVRMVKPQAVSVSLTEMLSDNDTKAAKSFYQWCNESQVSVQHILYSHKDLERFINLSHSGFIPPGNPQLLFVLGRYTKDQQSDPLWLNGFLELLNESDFKADWAVCAFGSNETQCAIYAAKRGGKCRIGFENSIWNTDGNVAKDNAERVTDVIKHLSNIPKDPSNL